MPALTDLYAEMANLGYWMGRGFGWRKQITRLSPGCRRDAQRFGLPTKSRSQLGVKRNYAAFFDL
jgi:hypothetical protein